MTTTTAQTLRVHGIPKAQGSKTAFVRGGKPIVAEAGSKESRSKHAAWRQAVATAARDLLEAGGHTYPASQPVDVGIDFVLPKPGSAPKYVRWAFRKPDLDKLARSVLDGLADGGLLAADQQVCQLACSKAYVVDGGAPGCVVVVRALEHGEAA